MRPGDVYMLNAPYNGGTHLPDITVVTPVFADAGARDPVLRREPRPSRGHRRPDARLDDAARHAPSRRKASTSTTSSWSTAAASCEAETHALLTGAKYPARRPDKNIADLKAQVAANAKGDAELRTMVAHFGLDVVAGLHGPRAGQRRGERAPAAVAARGRALPRRDGSGHARSRCASRVDRDTRTAKVDFTGTSAAAAEQLQRARARHARRRALRLPRHGRRADPDERRLPEADRDHHPGGLDAAPDAIRPPSSPATSRPARSSPTPVRARSARSARRRAR